MTALFTELLASVKMSITYLLHKDKNKYLDEAHKLEREYDEEVRKPIYEGPTGEIPKHLRQDYQDFAVVDDLCGRLCQLSRTVRSSAGGKDSVLQ